MALVSSAPSAPSPSLSYLVLHLAGFPSHTRAPIRISTQYQAYVEFAAHHSLVPEEAERKEVDVFMQSCARVLERTGNVGTPNECENVLETILAKSKVAGHCRNMYDIRLADPPTPGRACGPSTWPAGVKETTAYLSQAATRHAIHADTSTFKTWAECRTQPKLQLDTSPASVLLLPTLLKRLKVLLFSGDQDLICNWMGTRNFIAAMEWGRGAWRGPGWAMRHASCVMHHASCMG